MATYSADNSFIDVSLVNALNEAFGFINKVQQVEAYMRTKEMQDMSYNFYNTLGGE